MLARTSGPDPRRTVRTRAAILPGTRLVATAYVRP